MRDSSARCLLGVIQRAVKFEDETGADLARIAVRDTDKNIFNHASVQERSGTMGKRGPWKVHPTRRQLEE